MVTRRTVLTVAIGATITARSATTLGAPRNEGPGRAPWRHSRPDAHGLSATALDTAAKQLAAAGERQGLVVIRHGELVFERYWANDWARFKDLAVMAKDAKRFQDGGGWGYGLFDVDAASAGFKPNVTGATCGVACHAIVKSKDYVFTRYEKK